MLFSIFFHIDDKTIQISGQSTFMLFDVNPLSAAATKQEQQKSNETQLVDLYPLHSTIDFGNTNIYNMERNINGMYEIEFSF